MHDRLTALQRELLVAFFRTEAGFFLTGGAALAGFHLGHRTTLDLDLFTSRGDIDEGEALLRQGAAAVGGRIETLRTSPAFRRYLVTRGDESVVVDLVFDEVPQIHVEKPSFDGIRVDPLDEILVNKLCAVLSRGEIRDLVDVRALELAGVDLTEAVARASSKDAGFSPAQLAWVLGELRIGDDARIPGGIDAAELRRYTTDLRKRLARLAHPG